MDAVMKVLGKLKIWQKLALVAGLFLIPVVVMSYLYVGSTNYRIDFDDHIIAGDDYFRGGLAKLLVDVATSKAHTRRVLAGDTGSKQAMDEVRARVDGDFRELFQIDERLKEFLGTTPEALKTAKRDNAHPPLLKSQWDAIKGVTSPKMSDEMHNKLIADLIVLADQIGDESKLILDPDLDTYYVMDALLIREPRLIDLLAQLESQVEELIAKRQATNAERIATAALLAKLQGHLDGIKGDIDITIVNVPKFSGRKEFARNVEKPLQAGMGALAQVIGMVNERLVYSETINLQLQTLNEAIRTAMQGNLALWEVFVDEHVAMTDVRRGSWKDRRFWALASVLFLLSITFLMSFIVMQAITRPIAKAAAVAQQLASGDLPERIDVGKATDETGYLLRSLNQMLQFLDLRQTMLTLQESSKQLSDTVTGLERSTLEQSQAISSQAAALQETQVTAQEIKQTSLLASQKAESVLQYAERAETISRSGEAAVEQSLGALTEIRAQVDEIAQKIGKLSERTTQISDITQTVKDLADQSNMLALNAAIEAVRSGEHGKGFAVVAREIRSLADQSIQATNRVREILEDISGAIRSAVSITESGSQRIEAGLVQMKTSGDKIKDLSNIVRDNSASVRQIAAAVGQQNAGITQIFTAVTDQNKMMDDTVKRLETAKSAASLVKDVSDRVGDLVRRFRV
jgi:methyl-accepting chemotaxis protein